MKILKYIGLGIAGLLFLVVLISFFLPGTYKVERSIVIQTEASVPFKMAADFRAWDLWSPWHEIDTLMKKEYSETSGEVGSWYTWDSKNPNAGMGKATIMALEENRMIENKLDLNGMGTAKAMYFFEPDAEGTKVIWTLEGDAKGTPWYWQILGKYMYLNMDAMVGGDYEKGLKKLKAVCENQPKGEQVAGFDTEEREVPAMKVAGIRAKVKTSEMNSALFAKWFGTITQSLSKQQLQPAGAPMTIYHAYGPKEVDVEAAIPVATIGTNEGQVVFRDMSGSKAFVLKYHGGYGNMESVYTAAYEHIASKGMSSKGAPFEIYITDPGTEKDTAKWFTDIVFPLD
jgi:effector-binding domain-containing protein